MLNIDRIYKAPIELVFKAWTEVEYLEQWWGPSGVTIPVCKFEAQEAGDIDIVMLASQELGELAGTKWPMTGKVVEILAPTKLVFTSSPVVDGKPVMDTKNTVTLESIDANTTRLTLNIEVTNTTEAAKGPLSGMNIGWNQSLDRLASLINR